jgi:hypothetical protein
MTFISSLIGLASTQAEPPKISASLGDEAPGHRLVEPRAAAVRRTLRSTFCSGSRSAGDAGRARQRRRRHLVEAVDADDFLDDVGRAVHVATP